jgi:uncharacterized protein (TIGR03435 family)
MLRGQAVICLGLALAAAVWGQSGESSLRFEVASVRLSAKQGMITKVQGGPGTDDPGRFRMTNAELSMLVMRAYGIQYDQLKAPAWMDTTQFDVVANVPLGTTAEQLRKMLQNLLVERFRLQAHRETRVAPVYELTVGKNAPKLKPAAEGKGADDFVPGSALGRADRDGFPILPPGRPNVACAHVAHGSYCTFRMVTMERLVQQLSLPTFSDRRIVDKTGLTGRYDLTLYYNSGTHPPSPENDAAPDLVRAVQEQLGLRLASSTASIDVIVVDRAEKTPTEN